MLFPRLFLMYIYYIQAQAAIAEFGAFAERSTAADLTPGASSILPGRSTVQKPSFPRALLCTASCLRHTRDELHPDWGGSVFDGADGQMVPNNVKKKNIKN